MKADFEAFTKESGKVQGDVNHYNISSDKTLTDRAKEVMTVMSATSSCRTTSMTATR